VIVALEPDELVVQAESPGKNHSPSPPVVYVQFAAI